MGERARERRIIAYHTAGCTVVVRKLGLEIIGVNITPDLEVIVYHRSATQVALAIGEDRAALARGLYTDVMVRTAGTAAQKLVGCPADDDIAAFEYADRLACLEAGWPLRSLRLDPDQPRGPILQKYEDEDDEAVRRIFLEAGFELVPDELPELTLYSQELRDASSAIVDRAEKETTALLQADWPIVVRVAGVLAKRDRLSQEELDHVIARG